MTLWLIGRVVKARLQNVDKINIARRERERKREKDRETEREGETERERIPPLKEKLSISSPKFFVSQLFNKILSAPLPPIKILTYPLKFYSPNHQKEKFLTWAKLLRRNISDISIWSSCDDVIWLAVWIRIVYSIFSFDEIDDNDITITWWFSWGFDICSSIVAEQGARHPLFKYYGMISYIMLWLWGECFLTLVIGQSYPELLPDWCVYWAVRRCEKRKKLK